MTKVFIWVYCQTYTIDSSLLHSCCLNNILIFNFTEVLTIWMVILVFEVFSVSNISHNETFAAYLARAVSSILLVTKNVSFFHYNNDRVQQPISHAHSMRVTLCYFDYWIDIIKRKKWNKTCLINFYLVFEKEI